MKVTARLPLEHLPVWDELADGVQLTMRDDVPVMDESGQRVGTVVRVVGGPDGYELELSLAMTWPLLPGEVSVAPELHDPTEV